MRVRVLGQVEAAGPDGRMAPVGSPNQQVILAMLAAAGGGTVPPDRLVDALWGDDPPPSADRSLRSYVSRLRKMLGGALAAGPGGYTLDLSPDEVDLLWFEHLAAQARTAAGARALETLDAALDLWRGRPFGDAVDVPALVPTVVRLGELHAWLREARAAALLALGRYAEAVAAAEELVAEAPLREGSWVTLIDALAGANRAAEALRTYQRAAQTLAEAGLEPSSRLRRAESAVFEHEAPPIKAGTLPRRPATALVGRSADVEHLEGLMRTAQLITLVGPGGVGKTRLALELASRVAPRHEWGARMVALSSLRDPTAVPAVAVDALGIAMEDAEPLDALRRVGALDLFVVIDNCEHLIEGAATVVESLLAGGMRVRIVATSRERLGVDGEHVWSVAPLELVDADSPAIRLFVDRARAARPRLDLDASDIDVVRRIVRRLDGLPLAIEMAAARAATLPLPELAARLDENLDLLRSARPAAARHQTLGAVVEWSEALLDDDERAILGDFSAFAGSVTADDVAAVSGRSDALDTLCRLADRSLIVVDPRGDKAGFSMLETIRAHVRSRLLDMDRRADLARRHAAHVAEVAAGADAALRTPQEGAAAQRLEQLLPEFRAAHEWARDHDIARAAEISACLHLFAQSRLRAEPLEWAARLVDHIPNGDVRGAAAAIVHASAAQQAAHGGRFRAAEALAQRGIELGGDASETCYPLELLADVQSFEGRLDEAVRTSRESLRRAKPSGDNHFVVLATVGISLALAYRGDHAAAKETLAAPKLDPAMLSPSDAGWLAYCEGEITLDRDPERALAALARAIHLADSVGNRYVGGVARVSDCSLRARAGDTSEALAAFGDVIRHWRRSGSVTFQITTLRNLIVLLQRVGAAREAAELTGTVEHLQPGSPYGEESRRLADAVAWLETTLGGQLDASRAVGAQRNVDDAAATALSWIDRLLR